MKYKLIAFDMDGTLLVEDSCWRALHKNFGTEEKAKINLVAYENGEIDYPEFMRRDIALWQPLPNIDKITELLLGFRFAPNVAEVLSEINRRGYQTAIITGGIDILAEEVARRLKIKHILANGFETDERGQLTGEGIFGVEPTRKDEILTQLASRLGIGLNECVAVGDSKYDVRFLEKAGLGVAIGRDPRLLQVADVAIEDFYHFPQLLNYL